MAAPGINENGETEYGSLNDLIFALAIKQIAMEADALE